MKTRILQLAKDVLADRYLAILLSSILLGAFIFCLVIALTIHATDLQVVNRYTAFGSTNFYFDKWYYFFTFIGFGLIIAVMNVTLAVKLLSEKGRGFAIAYAWLSLIVLILAAFIARSILMVAFRA